MNPSTLNIKAIVTDIEGTTSSIDFVHKELFPYASRELPAFVRKHQQEAAVASQLEAVRQLIDNPAADVEQLIETLLQWIRDDNKATPLKALQGLVWAHGYESGAFTGHVYDDAVSNLKKWAAQGIDLYVYSSGSVAAQKLLFGYSDAGDLNPLFKGYFDTRIGNKREPQAYKTIVTQLDISAQEILFLSDVVEELDAAASVGMQTIQLVREQGMTTGAHTIVHDFNEISI